MCSSDLSFMVPEWRKNASQGVSWEKDSKENLKKLIELSDTICPEYLKRPNDKDALQSFIRAKVDSLDHSPEVQRDGNLLLQFLRTELSSTQRLFSPMSVNFSDSPCGSLMILLHKESSGRLKQIEQKSREIAKKCLSGAAAEAKAHLEERTKDISHSPKGNGPALRKNSTQAPASDITGLKPVKKK